jgi:hypothetical protein
MNKSETIAKISAALVKAQSEMGNANKGAANPFFKSKFADLNSIREASLPVLNAHGIAVLQGPVVVDGKPYVETTMIHESGEFLSCVTEIIAPKANDPQAHGSGMSYARRYGLQAFLCIGADDDDGEKAMGRSTGNKPAPKVEVKVEAKVETEVVAKKTGFGVKAQPVKETEEEGWN